MKILINQIKKEDEKVFPFINSEKCQSFWDLVNFVKKNDLPLRERWVFYLFGKINAISEQTFEDTMPPFYASYIFGEAYYWSSFLQNELNEWFSILERAEEAGEKIDNLEELLIKRGWEYVENSMEFDMESASNFIFSEHRKSEAYYESYEEESDDYCEVCQESPCRCSD